MASRCIPIAPPLIHRPYFSTSPVSVISTKAVPAMVQFNSFISENIFLIYLLPLPAAGAAAAIIVAPAATNTRLCSTLILDPIGT